MLKGDYKDLILRKAKSEQRERLEENPVRGVQAVSLAAAGCRRHFSDMSCSASPQNARQGCPWLKYLKFRVQSARAWLP